MKPSTASDFTPTPLSIPHKPVQPPTAQSSLPVERWGTALAFAAAAIALGYALQINNGSFHPQAIPWLTVALTLCIVGVAIPRFSFLEKFGERPTVYLLTGGFAFQLWQLLTASAALYSLSAGACAIMAVAILLFALSLPSPRWLSCLVVPLLLVIHFVIGVWTIKQTPDPFIDVYVFHKESLAALLKGINPYTLTIPNIYEHSNFYGEGVLVNGRVNVGFPYPPLSLLFALPGYLIGGDYRYSNLAAMTLSGAFMAYARPGRLSAIAAGIFLSTPRIFYVLELGWTEPYVVCLLAATVFCACRAPKYLPLALGFLFAVKQYMVLVAPVTFFLLPQPVHWKDVASLLGKAMLLAALLTVPMMLLDIGAFMNNVVLFQFRQPFRMDALSYLAWLAHGGGPRLPAVIGFVMVVPATLLAIWRGARTPAGFAAAVALIYFAFFAFSKQAFLNYYFFILGAMCCAVAATLPRYTTGPAK